MENFKIIHITNYINKSKLKNYNWIKTIGLNHNNYKLLLLID